MADLTVTDPPPNNFLYDDGLPIPPLDPTFLSEEFTNTDDQIDLVLNDIDFDFSFDDLYLPPFDDTEGNNDFTPGSYDPTQSELFNPDNCQPDNQNAYANAFKTTSSEFPNSESPVSSKKSRVVNSTITGDISSYLNVQSPEDDQISGDRSGNMKVPPPEQDWSNKACTEVRVLNCPSPVDSQGSGNCRSNVSEADSNKSVTSSPDFAKNSIKNGVVDSQIKLEGYMRNENNVKDISLNHSNKNSLLKRKKDNEDSDSNNGSDTNIDSRTNKYRKANNSQSGGENDKLMSDDDKKRKTRLMRNRESAQLSRQRKKHYVEELEDKVRAMHSTIQDLNAKISYVMTENVTLRQQLGSSGVVPGAAPPPGMYPPPPMMYPWMPAPPYMMKSQGSSQVPLLPIPRLKPQPIVSTPKTSKKGETKKSEGKTKTKKVASVSFLGILFFLLLFGGLVPMVNVRNVAREAFTGRGSDFVGRISSENHRGRVLTVNGTEKCNGGPESKGGGNSSEALMASLYVPRNDKLVKIDGNLIIHSVLASEKAMAESKESKYLVIPRNMPPAVPYVKGHPHLALGPAYSEKESTSADRGLQQWFREGLAGPMLSSGMCTEVFQFEVSPASIIPATSSKNVTSDHVKNSTHLNKALNRRILHRVPIPLPGSSSHNHTDKKDSQKERFNETNSNSSSMVVSVLFDPREGADSDGEDIIGGQKSLSRIFVVVMIDSVKYVTYSCMLPFIKGTVPHLVTV